MHWQLIVGDILETQVVRTLTSPSLGLLILMWFSARALLYISAQASYCTSLASESSELAALFSVSHASCGQLQQQRSFGVDAVKTGLASFWLLLYTDALQTKEPLIRSESM